MFKIVQLGEVLIDIPIFENVLSSVAKKETDLTRDLRNRFLDKQINRFSKEYITGSGITLANNKTKYITKMIKSLEKLEEFY